MNASFTPRPSRIRRARRESFGLPEALEPRALLAVVLGPTPIETITPRFHEQVIADFDGDTINDMAAISSDNVRHILFFKGNGDGAFQPAQTTTLNVRAERLSAVTLTPGDPAFLVALGGAGVPIAFNPNVGSRRATFVRLMQFSDATEKLEVVALTSVAAPPQGDQYPTKASAGDFTGDGAIDFAFAPSSGKDRIVVVERNGTSAIRIARSLTVPTPLSREGNFPAAPVAADVNNDGRLDLISDTTSGYVALLNSPTGLQPATVSLGLSSMFVWKFADVTGDGKVDAVSMWTPPAQVNSHQPDRFTVIRVKPGLGASNFGAIQTIARLPIGTGFFRDTFPPSESETLLVGPDIDADGRADIIYIRDSSIATRYGLEIRERIVGLTHAPDGSWLPPDILLGPNDISGALGEQMGILHGRERNLFGDLHGDGRADMLDFSELSIRAFLIEEA